MAEVAGLSALERGKLMYVEAANEWLLIREEVYADRSTAQMSDADWAAFDAIQNDVRAISLPLVEMRHEWERTGVKPAGWDAAMANLLLKIEAASKLVGGKR